MFRKPNTARNGSNFSEATVKAVWEKGAAEPGYIGFRKDTCGASMQFSAYGKTETFGWEIDHIRPISSGGSDELNNLQPLHWENNRAKGDHYPSWTCSLIR